jgi:hypothetical protein
MNDPDNSMYGLIARYNGLDRVLHGEVIIFSPLPGSDPDPAREASARRFGVGDEGPLRMFTSANGPLVGLITLLGSSASLRCSDSWGASRFSGQEPGTKGPCSSGSFGASLA